MVIKIYNDNWTWRQIVIKKQTQNNIQNGEEYDGLIKTPYWNLMLDR